MYDNTLVLENENSMLNDSDQMVSLEKVVENNDSDEVDYFKYKNQLKQLKEESKPGYQRGQKRKTKGKESLT